MPLYRYQALQEVSDKARYSRAELLRVYRNLHVAITRVIIKLNPPISQLRLDDPRLEHEPIRALMTASRLRTGNDLSLELKNEKAVLRAVQTLNSVLEIFPDFRKLEKKLGADFVELFWIKEQAGPYKADRRGLLRSIWWAVVDGRVKVREGLPAMLVAQWQDRADGWLMRVDVMRKMSDLVAELLEICGGFENVSMEQQLPAGFRDTPDVLTSRDSLRRRRL